MKDENQSPPGKEDLGGSLYIPYNANLKELSRENRKNPTKAEKKIWKEILRSNKLNGLRFLRQKPLHQFIVDFYCSKILLVIEIDGGIHNKKVSKEYDKERTAILNQFGIKVIRYANNEVLTNIERIKKDLIDQVNIRKKELNL